MRLKGSYHAYAAVTVLLWSLTYLFTRYAAQYFTPYGLAFLRYGTASLALIPFVLHKRLSPPKPKHYPLFAASGAAGFSLCILVFNVGMHTVPSSTGSLVIATVPAITAFLARFFYKEKLRAVQWAAIGVELCGIAVMLFMQGFTANSGIAWLLLSALLQSVYNILQRRLSALYSPLQAAVYSIFAGTLMLLAFAPEGVRQLTAAPPAQYAYILMLGVLCSAVAYVTWTVALAKADKASDVCNYMFLTPFLASLWGAACAGEVPESATLLGGGVILLGALCFNLGRRAKEPHLDGGSAPVFRLPPLHRHRKHPGPALKAS